MFGNLYEHGEMKERGLGLEGLDIKDNQKGSKARKQNRRIAEIAIIRELERHCSCRSYWTNELTKHAFLFLFFFGV